MSARHTPRSTIMRVDVCMWMCVCACQRGERRGGGGGGGSDLKGRQQELDEAKQEAPAVLEFAAGLQLLCTILLKAHPAHNTHVSDAKAPRGIAHICMCTCHLACPDTLQCMVPGGGGLTWHITLQLSRGESLHLPCQHSLMVGENMRKASQSRFKWLQDSCSDSCRGKNAAR